MLDPRSRIWLLGSRMEKSQGPGSRRSVNFFPKKRNRKCKLKQRLYMVFGIFITGMFTCPFILFRHKLHFPLHFNTKLKHYQTFMKEHLTTVLMYLPCRYTISHKDKNMFWHTLNMYLSRYPMNKSTNEFIIPHEISISMSLK